MNELMVHVERIVRPVAATQRRKLRMRLELLMHLQEAVDEELCCRDEQAAIEQANQRLGASDDLTADLQRTVPALERLLLHDFGQLYPDDHSKPRTARLMPALGEPITLAQKSALLNLGFVLFSPALLSLASVSTRGTPAKHLMLAMVVLSLGALTLLLACLRFAFRAGGSDSRSSISLPLRFGGMILAMQIVFTILSAYTVGDRTATATEFATCAAWTVSSLVMAVFIARRIGLRRRVYEPWLTLEQAAFSEQIQLKPTP